MSKLILIPMVLLMSLSAKAQVCDDNINSSTTETQFVVNQENSQIALDVETGISWSRCVLGMHFNDDQGKCEGSVKAFYSENDLFDYVATINNEGYLGRNDWQIPNIKELGTIIERSCYDPAINLTIFPSSSNISLVSNTPDDGKTGFGLKYINLRSGEEFTSSTLFLPGLRLMFRED